MLVIKQLFQKDEVAQVGDVIAIISTDGSAAAPSAPAAKIETEITNLKEKIKTTRRLCTFILHLRLC